MNCVRLPHLALAAGLILGVSAPLSALENSAATSTPGLLGRSYLGLSYAWYDYSDLPVNAHGLAVELNYPIRPGLDFTTNYDWLQTDSLFGISARLQTAQFGLRAFTHAAGQTRYYLDAAGGWAWADAGGVVSDNSSTYRLGVGAEIALTPAFSLTPFLYYLAYPDNGGSGTFNYGLRANAWVQRNWALTASILRNDSSDLSFNLGVNRRF